ncbi:MAG: hypothetical protein ACQKBU_03445, partial [Verrucomicrobiales bacterium]
MPRLLFLAPLLLAACANDSAAPSSRDPIAANDHAPTFVESLQDSPDEPAPRTTNDLPSGSDAVATWEHSAPFHKAQLIHAELDSIRVDALVFDSRTHEIVVADQVDGPGSVWPTAAAAGRA